MRLLSALTSYKKLPEFQVTFFPLGVNVSFFSAKIFYLFMKENKQHAKVFSRRNSQKPPNYDPLTFLDKFFFLRSVVSVYLKLGLCSALKSLARNLKLC